MLVLLFLLLLAALAGVLGLVLKITLVIVLTAILSIAALLAIAWFGFRHQVRKLQREGAVTHTTIRIGDPTRDLPSRDDRY
jgi:membrane protein implicated in regulation of membrane protease activity